MLFRVQRQLHHLVSSNTSLQYAIELGADGLVDGSPQCPLTTPERLRLLLAQRTAWRRLHPHTTLTFPVETNWFAFDIAGGVLASYRLTAENQLALRTLPSRAFGGSTLGAKHMPLDIKDFAIDPAQDLFALVEGFRGAPTVEVGEFAAAGADGVLRIHLRTLRSLGLETHSAARTHTLEVHMLQHLQYVKLQIAEDVLAVFTHIVPAVLSIWNWRTGQELVHFREDASPDRTSDFAFLSPRAYLLTDRSGLVHLYPLDGAPAPPNSPSNTRSLPPDDARRVTLALPALDRGHELDYVACHTGPFVSNAGERAPFAPASDARVHVLVIQADMHAGEAALASEILESVALAFVISTAALLRFLGNHPTAATIKDPDAVVLERRIPWADWGPTCSRVFDLGFEEHVSERAVHGARVVMPTRSLKDPEQYHLQVLDFNASRRGLDIVSDVPPAKGELIAEGALIRSPTGLAEHAQVIFVEPVESHLPYYAATFGKDVFDVDDELLMDDARLVRYPAEEDERTADRMDVFVF
ncbi:hypothetical protein K488DRAFT_85136 [Vararia minispora EC-137]|uniref:Uncharacterized protein n=1 Tax=Vararia minispora EC-137 TaxID=1314806 RepID=A0ACB8QNF7_9AGAM|nr:hypothetical protein K488DRAFT_85136 [Vararia minispora EC-137]